MLVSEHKHVSEVMVAPTQRLEVFTGTGRRRTWTAGEKASIVAESYAAGATACQVARRHGLTPQQLFTWRRQARQSEKASAETEVPRFVPAVVDAMLPMSAIHGRQHKRSRRADLASGNIEVEIDGVTVRIGRKRCAERTLLATSVMGEFVDL
jgi:transposase